MSILNVSAADAPFSIIVAEHRDSRLIVGANGSCPTTVQKKTRQDDNRFADLFWDVLGPRKIGGHI